MNIYDIPLVYQTLKLLHLIGASVWLGGMILISAIVPVVKQEDKSGKIVTLLVTRFRQIGWYAFFLSAASGLMMWLYGWTESTILQYQSYQLKFFLLFLTGILTYLQTKLQFLNPVQKGLIQGIILLSTFGIFFTSIYFAS